MKIVEIQSENHLVKINQTIGAFAYSWVYRGKEMLFAPPLEMQAGYGKLFGIPLMYPFANRLLPAQLSLETKESVPLNAVAGPWLKDGNGLIMHGLTWQQERWVYEATKSSGDSACFSLKWDEHSDLFPYLPIKHEIEIRYQLLEDGLRVITSIKNLDKEVLPLSYGYHPYFLISREGQSENEIKIPATGYYETNEQLLPTGNILPVADLFQADRFNHIEEMNLDTCFTGFSQENQKAFSIELNKNSQQICVKMDAQFSNAIVYLPKDKNKPYICIEPMIGATNAWHNQFDQLPKVPPFGSHQTFFDITVKER